MAASSQRQRQNLQAHFPTSVKRRRSPGLYNFSLHTAPRRSSFIASPSPRYGLQPTNLRRMSAIGSSPACRKSLYGRLPTSVKQHSEVSLTRDLGLGKLEDSGFSSHHASSSFIRDPFPSFLRSELLSGVPNSQHIHSPFIETFKSRTQTQEPRASGSLPITSDPFKDFTHPSFSSEHSSLLPNSDFSDTTETKRSRLSGNSIKTGGEDVTSHSFIAPLPKPELTKTTNNLCSSTSTPANPIPPPNSGRKSLDNLIKRFIKVKHSMQQSSKK